MSLIPEALLTRLATEYFVTPVIKVAMYHNTGPAFGTDVVFADVEPFLIADGYLGSAWYELVLDPADFTYDGLSLVFPSKSIVFGRDSSVTPLIFNGVAVFQEDQVGTDHVLLGLQPSQYPLVIEPGQGATVYVSGGFLG